MGGGPAAPGAYGAGSFGSKGGREEAKRQEKISRDVEDCLFKNNVDENAANDLRGCPPEVQARVIDRGSISSARNPSAALIARIKESRKEVDASGGDGGRGG